MAANLLLGLIAAFFGYAAPAFVLIVLFFFAAASRLWARASSKGLKFDVKCSADILYPGESCCFDVKIKNNSIIPAVWSELFMPLAKSLCVMPEDPKLPDPWESAQLSEYGASDLSVGKENFPAIMWFGEKEITLNWHAKKRGVYSTGKWTAAAGDGFGLTQLEWPVFTEDPINIAVFPTRCNVNTALFLRNMWNSETSKRGITDDPTVIRSTRDYSYGDSAKNINWRMLAKGQDLSVNVFEQIKPSGIHFIFDGQSFAGAEPHLADMEEALSILGSVIEKIFGMVSCGLSLPFGENCEAKSIFAASSAQELLYQLALYNPFPQKYDEHHDPVKQISVFPEREILESKRNTGHYYYIAYDFNEASDAGLLQKLDPFDTTLLSFRKCEAFSNFKTLCLADIKEAAE